MRRQPWSRLLAPFVLLSLLILGASSAANASSPNVGRNFSFPLAPGDVVVVTFVEDLPVTSADVYFDIFIEDWGVGGEPVIEGQLVYTIPWELYPPTNDPVQIWLGTYGTVTRNGVPVPTFDGDLIDGVQSVTPMISGPDAWGRILLRASVVITDPVLGEKWSTLEFIPSDWVGLTQEEIDAITASLRSLRVVDYGFHYTDRYFSFACAAGSFSIRPHVSLGPDNFVVGPPQTVNCPGTSDIWAKQAGAGGAEIVNGGTLTFPPAVMTALPMTRDLNICNVGPGGLVFPEQASTVSGAGFTSVWGSLGPANSVGAGQCTTIRIRFSPSAPGTYTGAVTINSNDPDEDPFQILLSATAVADQPNLAPVVNAGIDQSITLPAQAVLDGSVMDDGAPNPPGTVTTNWLGISGPGFAIVSNPSAVDTTVTFSEPGTYIMRLTANDSLLSASDTVTIIVNPPSNQPPSVNAGADQTITLPAAALLDSTVSDDGFPNPPGSVSLSWSKVSGPGTVTFANPGAGDTSAVFSAPGSYVLRLSANDGAAVASDDITVTVNPAAAGGKIYLSATTNGTLPGVGGFADEDILAFDLATATWSLYFDGSDVGLGGTNVDVDALVVLANGRILLSTLDPVSLPGIGTVDDSDIVEFTPTSLGSTTAGAYSLFFDGSDVGLTTSAEDVDGIAFTADGRLVISTEGNYSVPGLAGGADEDLLVLNNGSFGSNTGGVWGIYFDGSDVALSGSEDIADAWIAANGDIYLVAGSSGFAVTGGVSGQSSDIFRCTPGILGASTTCTYAFFWDGAAYNFGSAVIDGLALSN